MREYFHSQELWKEDEDPVLKEILEETLGGDQVLKEKQVPYKGSNVLAIQARDAAGHKYVIVPGIIISYKEKVHGKGRVPVSEVEPIGPEERQDVEKLLRDASFEGPINFW